MRLEQIKHTHRQNRVTGSIRKVGEGKVRWRSGARWERIALAGFVTSLCRGKNTSCPEVENVSLLGRDAQVYQKSTEDRMFMQVSKRCSQGATWSSQTKFSSGVMKI